MYQHFFKRLLDILISLAGLLVLAIPMLLIALIVKLDSPGPVFFKQKRVGRRKTYFMILKFRSMPTEIPHDVPTNELENPEAFLSKWQRFERKTSIDELPQLINILKGDMSIIGPRPALWNQFELIALRDTYGANDIRPGLTGWAQINGRDELSDAVKSRYDGEYVRNMSFLFDCKCFFGTVKKVLTCDGVVEGGVKESDASRKPIEK